MILIFTEHNDASTIKVIDWLKFVHNKDFLRINTDFETPISIKSLNGTQSFLFKHEENIVDFTEINAIWFRRGSFKINKNIIKEENIESRLVNEYINYESSVLTDYLNYLLQRKQFLGSPYLQDINKLYVLEKAESLKIKIPKTNILTTKSDLALFIKRKKAITKAIGGTLFIRTPEYNLFSMTNLIEKKHLKYIPDTFPPSLFQEYIEKKYEIRTFYLKGSCYSMAIFSQTDEKTRVDFRNYNHSKPNRRVPFQLPKTMENKIRKLMKGLGLDTGSLDIIVNKKNQFVFLEVNPVGQFGMVSFPCNYQLEKKIADILAYEKK